jgi:hypothetical protein
MEGIPVMDYAKEYDRMVVRSNSQQEEIEHLHQQLAEKDAEHGRELRRIGKQTEAVVRALQSEIAASQARERQLREVLGICLKEIESWCDEVGYERFNHPEVNKALALPQDTSALEALITKAGEVMRERCVQEWIVALQTPGVTVDDAIRALPGVKLEDLK